jgi:hypothetical protein
MHLIGPLSGPGRATRFARKAHTGCPSGLSPAVSGRRRDSQKSSEPVRNIEDVTCVSTTENLATPSVNSEGRSFAQFNLRSHVMTYEKVVVTARPGPSVTAVAINIDGIPVALVNDTGVATLISPGRYIVTWHFSGNPGEVLGITVAARGAPVLQVKKSRVPSGENAGAGIDRFDI